MKITYSNGIIPFVELKDGDVFEFANESLPHPHVKFSSLDKTIHYNAIDLEKGILSSCDDACEVIKLNAELVIKR